MEHLASLAELEQPFYEQVKDEENVVNRCGSKRKNTDFVYHYRCNNYPYFESDAQIRPKDVLPPHGHLLYLFPRDEYRNYFCVFQGCDKPIQSGCLQEYYSHLEMHVQRQDILLANMLRKNKGANNSATSENEQSSPRMRQLFGDNLLPPLIDGRHVLHDEDSPQTDGESYVASMEDTDEGRSSDGSDSGIEKRRIGSRRMCVQEKASAENLYNVPGNDQSISPPYSPEGISLPSPTGDGDGYSIPTKPSSRGVQLREQMLRYGLNLFRMDCEGKYVCFFHGCSLRMITNFSRHIAKHEKNGDAIKQELKHLRKNPPPGPQSIPTNNIDPHPKQQSKPKNPTKKIMKVPDTDDSQVLKLEGSSSACFSWTLSRSTPMETPHCQILSVHKPAMPSSLPSAVNSHEIQWVFKNSSRA